LGLFVLRDKLDFVLRKKGEEEEKEVEEKLLQLARKSVLCRVSSLIDG
jgi:hypothetical protein